MKDEFFHIDDSDVSSAAPHLSEDEINSPEFDPEDFAPAPEDPMDQKNDDEAKGRRAAMIFAIIAALFTLIIAAVGALGSGKIENAESNIRRDKVFASFDNCSYARYYSTVEDCDIYVVIYKDRLAGYGVYKTVEGFGGEIEVLVCFDSANTVSTVKIVSENESDGLGDKIRKKSFLSGFAGMSSENITDMSAELDLISGATVSSNAVKNAVSDIIKLGISSFSIAKDLGIETVSKSEIEDDISKDTADTTDEDNSDDTTKGTPSVTTNSVDSSKLDGESGGAGNTVTGNGNISIDVTDVTTVYESDGEVDDTTDTNTGDSAADTPSVDTPPDTTEPSVSSDPVSSDDDSVSSEPDNTEPETPPDTTDNGGDDTADTKEPVDNSQGGMTE